MDIRLRGLEDTDGAWIIARHGAHYAESDGFDGSFPELVAKILADFHRSHDPARERGWIAEDAQGSRMGSIFCVTEAPDTPDVGKLRLFYVEPVARGTGLAQTMLETCVGFARVTGYGRIRLWTHESHIAAGRLYDRNGFVLTDSRAAMSFGQNVVEQVWERGL